jgi:hypothetical protein
MIEFRNGEARFVPEEDGHLDIEKCKAELRSLQVNPESRLRRIIRRIWKALAW